MCRRQEVSVDATQEAPVHAVNLSPFLIGKYEVTQGQWERLEGANPSRYPPSVGGVEGINAYLTTKTVSTRHG